MFYKTEELRQQMLENPQSYYAVAVKQVEEDLRKTGWDHEVHVPLTEACYHYMSTNEEGNPQVVGMPCWLYSVRASEGTHVFATFAVWTAVQDICTLIPEIEVIGFYGENEKGEQDHSRMLFCKEDEYAAIRQILQIVPVNKKTCHLSLVVDNVNTVEAAAASYQLTHERLIDLLKQYVSTNYMPTAQVTHYRHRVPTAIKAQDDGDFLRQMLMQEHTGFFYRDALRRGETYLVLKINDYTFVIGLKSHFSVVMQGQRPFQDMGNKSYPVNLDELLEILQGLGQGVEFK